MSETSEVATLRESLRAALLREHDLACELRRVQEEGLDRRDYIAPRIGAEFPIVDGDERIVAFGVARMAPLGKEWEMWEISLFHPASKGHAVVMYQVRKP